MADLLRFVFSIGGAVVAILVGSLWRALRPRSRLARAFLVIIILAYAVASMPAVSNRAARRLASGYRPLASSDVPAGPTAIVLLGSGSFTAHDWEDRNRMTLLDPAGANRTIETLRVFKMLDAAWVISSGGSPTAEGDWSQPSGTAMRDELVRLGVPTSRILVEATSMTTRDEAVLVAEMLKPLNVANVVLVTTDIHMRRSLGAFRASGMRPIPAPARRPMRRPPWGIPYLPCQSGLDDFEDVVHELAGIGGYYLRGWYQGS